MKYKYEKDNLPVYEIFIDEFDESGIRFVSLTSEPAIKVMGMYFNDHDEEYFDFDDFAIPPCHPNCKCYILNGVWTTEPDVCELCLEKKAEWETKRAARKSGRERIRSVTRKGKFEMMFTGDAEKQIIAGPVIIPNIKIYRNNEDEEYYVVFTKENIKRLVDKFQRSNNNKSINIDHTNVLAPAHIIGSWIIEDTTYDKSKYYGFNDLPIGTWFIEVHIPDEEFFKTEIKENNKYGFSIEGLLNQKLVSLKTENEPTIDDVIDSLDEVECIRLMKDILKK